MSALTLSMIIQLLIAAVSFFLAVHYDFPFAWFGFGWCAALAFTTVFIWRWSR